MPPSSLHSNKPVNTLNAFAFFKKPIIYICLKNKFGMGHCAVSPPLLLKYFREKKMSEGLSTVLTTS